MRMALRPSPFQGEARWGFEIRVSVWIGSRSMDLVQTGGHHPHPSSPSKEGEGLQEPVLFTSAFCLLTSDFGLG